MPWSIKEDYEDCSGFAVVKDSDGSIAGCHETRDDALAQQRALYASESKEIDEDVVRLQLSAETHTPHKGVVIEMDPRTLSAIVDTTTNDSYTIITSSDNTGPGPEKKEQHKREGGVDFPPDDYAYVPDRGKPATWKLRLTESPGKVTRAQLARAAAALSPTGFRGNKVKLPREVLASVKRRIRAEYRKLGVSDSEIPPSVKASPISFKMTDDGQMLWFAIYSNKYRDRDHPPEIISEKSHMRFVEMVESGLVSYPELWHWHLDGTRFGEAKALGYTDGFAWASGIIDKGKEDEAFALSQMDVAVSHGLFPLIRRKEDKSVIDMHITFEISPLTSYAAANDLTYFSTSEKGIDTVTHDQIEHLKDLGWSQEEIDEMANTMKKGAAKAELEQRESKQVEEVAEVVAEAVADDVQEQVEEVEEKAAVVEAPITRDEIAEAMAGIVNPLVDSLKEIGAKLAGMEERIDAVSKQVSGLEQDDAERLASKAAATPTASLADIVAAQLRGDMFTKNAAVPSDAKAVTPTETQAPDPQTTGSAFLDKLIRGGN